MCPSSSYVTKSRCLIAFSHELWEAFDTGTCHFLTIPTKTATNISITCTFLKREQAGWTDFISFFCSFVCFFKLLWNCSSLEVFHKLDFHKPLVFAISLFVQKLWMAIHTLLLSVTLSMAVDAALRRDGLCLRKMVVA